MISLTRIGTLADNRQTYLRGVALYNAGKIAHIRQHAHPFYAMYLTATVSENTATSHTVTLGTDSREDITTKSCTCSTFQRNGGFCKHMVAVLVHKYYADMLSGIPTAATDIADASDPAATDMLKAYTAQSVLSVGHRQVRLEPTLLLSPHRAAVSFRVVEQRPYVIKNLESFCEAMHTHRIVEYGSQLRFRHDFTQFHPDSHPLLRFLLRHFEEQHLALSENGAVVAGRFARELTLSDGALKELLTLYAHTPLAFVWGEQTGMCIPEEGDPTLVINAEKSEKGYNFTSSFCALSRGGSRLYLLTGNRLYRCSADYSAALSPLLLALQSGQGRLFVSERDLPLFCKTVLPAAAPYIRTDGVWPSADIYPLPHAEVRIFLDAPSLTRITARLEMEYSGVKVNPFSQKNVSIPRNQPLEHRVCTLLQEYFTVYLPEDEALVLQDDDAGIFRFITEGIAALNTVAEVMATHSFRHIGSTQTPHVSIGVTVDNQLLQFSFSASDIPKEELVAVLQQYRLKKTYYRLRNGRFLLLQNNELEALSQISAGLALSDKDIRRGHTALPAYRALYLDKVAEALPSLAFARDTAFRRIVDTFRSIDTSVKPPLALSSVLRTYQVSGFQWAKSLEALHCGGILADEMGLGKTLQIITLFLDAKEHGNTVPSLVVCPTSLVLNWESEIRRFAPSLTCLPLIGTAEQREQLIGDCGHFDVVITSYDLLKRDTALYNGRAFYYHILDEAQYIKNPHTQNARAVKAIAASHRIALTGTPIENHIRELWSIFDFLMPHYLYSYTWFRTHFEIPIVREGDDTARTQLRRLVEPFILRRLKKDVLKELPPKTEQILTIPLEGEQRALYDANLAQARRELHTPHLSKIAVLSLLMRLRQLCCDPSLCYDNYAGTSAKMDVCMEWIRQGEENGHKILVFSQFTSLLSRLQLQLDAQNIRYYRLDGSTPKEQRIADTTAFNHDDTPVYLISLKSGGTGLNLASADMVIHFDPWWNMAAQEQATDRAHRIGQTRPVQVVKLIAQNTVEERILAMQQRKQSLADTLIPVGEGLNEMNAEELRAILEQDM